MKNLSLLLSLFLLFSCNISEPKLSRFDWQINWLYNPQTGSFSKFLSVLVVVDGIDHARTSPIIKIVRKDLSLSWDIPPSKEEVLLKSSLYQSGHITIEHDLPPGNYTLTVSDIRGPISETGFFVPDLGIPPISAFPYLEGKKLSQEFDRAILLVYRNQQFFLMSHLYNTLFLPDKEPGEDFYLYHFDTNIGAGLISGPY
ncbi:MAG: hypothetical protein ACRCVN_03655 [Spirochaetia bacterium]